MNEEERERVISEKVIGITLEKITDMTREEAIARIQEHMIAHKMKEPRAVLISVALDMAVNALKQEPREHGEWIRVDDTKVKCSKCEITHFIAQYPHGKIDFCPNCGADMRGEWTDEVIEKQGNKLIECMTTEACKIAKGNIDMARKILAGKISEEEEKQLIFGADMGKEQNNG